MAGEIAEHRPEFPPGYLPTVLICERIDDGETVTFLTGLTPVDAATLVSQAAFAQLTVGVPEISTAPAADALLLVGVRTWFWNGNGEPVSATATIPGLSATVTATPGSTRFTFDDGTVLDCADGGTPYQAGRPASQQPDACTHVFQTSGHHVVQAETTWTLAWTATNGVTGTLPDLTRTTTVDLPLHAAEAETD